MHKLIAVSLLLIILTGCSASAEPTATVPPAPTFTAVPISTPIREPLTIALSQTSTSDVIASPAPEGEPTAEWNGIPIMPEAIAREGDEEGYVFTIKASSQQVQDYYQLELAALGWQSLSQETDDSSRVLIFSQDVSGTVTITILTRGDEALVLLTK